MEETRDEIQQGMESIKEDIQKSMKDIKDEVSKLTRAAAMAANMTGPPPMRHQDPACTSYVEGV